jgi:putative membrane protein insertion efficiency factor
MRTVLLALLRAYQYAVRPMLGANCRFYPSCSDYARAAIERHGVGKGSWLAARRLARCHPYHPGGHDPVP